MLPEHTTTLTKNEFRTFLIRLGKIFSNISILGLVLCLSGALSFLSLIFTFLIGAIVIVSTLGLIFLIAPGFMSVLGSIIEVSAQLSGFFLENFKIFASITIIGSVLALALLLTDKRTKHTGRIVLAVLVIAAVILLIIAVAAEAMK